MKISPTYSTGCHTLRLEVIPVFAKKEGKKKLFLYTMGGEKLILHSMVTQIKSNLQKKKKNYSQIYIPFFDFPKTQLKQG